MLTKDAKIFRASSIRGIYNKDLDERITTLIGKAFGTFIGKKKKILVARDIRTSSKNLHDSLIIGLTSVGCDVTDIGEVTTPMFFFAISKYKMDGGVCVTASHNPAEWNGFKLCDKDGLLFGDDYEMKNIKEIFISEKFADTKDHGKTNVVDMTRDYKDFILSKINTTKRLKIVLDPGNGVTSLFVEDIFKSSGHEVIIINGTPDGTFPSRPSDPVEENVVHLKTEVVSRGADMGVAFDGDGDRLAIVDDSGRYVQSGNVTIPILVEYYLKKFRGGKIVYDVCCSSVVEEIIRKMGGIPIISKVGQTFIKINMSKEKAVFGGEYSNHLNFVETFLSDDAFYGALKLAEIIGFKNKTLSQIVDEVPKYPASKVLEIPCDDRIKFKVVTKIADRLKSGGFRTIVIDGVKAFDGENNWMLIRPSNTLPVIKINSEAKTENRMKELFEKARNLVKEEIENENSNN